MNPLFRVLLLLVGAVLLFLSPQWATLASGTSDTIGAAAADTLADSGGGQHADTSGDIVHETNIKQEPGTPPQRARNEPTAVADAVTGQEAGDDDLSLHDQRDLLDHDHDHDEQDDAGLADTYTDRLVPVDTREQLDDFLSPRDGSVGGGLLAVFHLPKLRSSSSQPHQSSSSGSSSSGSSRSSLGDNANQDDETDDADQLLPEEYDAFLAQDIESFGECTRHATLKGVRIGVGTSEFMVREFEVPARDVDTQQGGWKIVVLQDPVLSSAKHGDKPTSQYPETRIVPSAVVSFTRANLYPLVSQVDQRSLVLMTRENPSVPIVVVFAHLDRSEPKFMNYLANRLRRVAVQFVGRAHFVLCDLQERIPELSPSDFTGDPTSGIWTRSVTAVHLRTMIVGVRDSSHYALMDAKFSGEALFTFVNDYFNDRPLTWRVRTRESVAAAERAARAAAAGLDVLAKYVKELSGAQVDRLLAVRPIDAVLFFYYEPDCDDCLAFSAEFEKLGKLLKGQMIVAKVDASHQVDFGQGAVVVEQFPGLWVVPKMGGGPPVPHKALAPLDNNRSKKPFDFLELEIFVRNAVLNSSQQRNVPESSSGGSDDGSGRAGPVKEDL